MGEIIGGEWKEGRNHGFHRECGGCPEVLYPARPIQEWWNTNEAREETRQRRDRHVKGMFHSQWRKIKGLSKLGISAWEEGKAKLSKTATLARKGVVRTEGGTQRGRRMPVRSVT